MRTEVLKRLQDLYPSEFGKFTIGLNEADPYYYYDVVCSLDAPESSRILLKAARKYYNLVVL